MFAKLFVFTFVVSAFVARDIVSCRSCERTHWSHGFVSHHSSWFFRSSPTFVLWHWQSVSVCVLSFFMFLLVGSILSRIRCHAKAATWKTGRIWPPEPGQSPGQRWLFPTSSQFAALLEQGKNIVSAGECRTIGQQLADFVQILDETPSVRFQMIQDTIYQS